MRIEEYYHREYREDLNRIRLAGGIDKDKKLSIICMLPDEPPTLVEAWRCFQSIEKKHRFLFYFFLCVTLDQAVRSGLNEHRHDFDELADYPKFVGILSGYYTNLHPAIILEIVSLYVKREDEECVVGEFKFLSKLFAEDVIHVLNKTFFSNRRNSENNDDLIVRVFKEMIDAFPLIYSLEDGLKDQCARHFRSELERRLEAYQVSLRNR